MFKKWWFYVILAVVIILIAVPLGTIIRLNKSVYDLSFNYEEVKVDDLLTEIAKKSLYYDAETKTLEVEINQDLINSILKDQLAQLDLGLPEKFSIQAAAFKTADQRLYINAKYGSINLPVSALVHIEPNETGINIYADSINLGDKKAPGYIANQIPVDQLRFSLNYADFGVPQIFTITDVKYGTGNVNAFIQLDVEAIKALARDYRNELETTINSFKLSAGEPIATFIDKALAEGLLSDTNVNKYVEQVLDNEELVNSAVYFAVSPDLDKYSKSLETYQKAISDWAAPLSTVKLDGTLEETVDSILYNQELQNMLAWFIPAATLTEYVDTADTYYTTVNTALKSLQFDGTLEGTLDTVLYNRALQDALTLFIPAATLNDYVNTADQYYSAYKSASNSLNRLSRILEKGDIEGAVQQIINDRELYGALSVVIPKDNIDSYIGSISEYYQLYADVTTALTDALESIPDEEINKFVNEAIKYAYDVDNGKSYLTTLIAGVDTQYIQDYVEYIDQNETVLKSMIHPVYYDDFMAYVDSLDVLKQYLVDNIKSADVSAVKEGADIINEVNKDLMNVLDLLKSQKYDQAGAAIGKISFDKVEAFIEAQIPSN
jgi:hypothetical protein